MNIRFGNKQNLIECAEDLEDISAHKEQPAPFDWDKYRQMLEDMAVFLRTYTIPRTPEEEPGYKSGNGKVAPLVIPQRPDLEVKEDDSSASFLPTGRNNQP